MGVFSARPLQVMFYGLSYLSFRFFFLFSKIMITYIQFSSQFIFFLYFINLIIIYDIRGLIVFS